MLGARVIGTAAEASFGIVQRFGGEPVRYGDGLEQRVRDLADGPVTVAIDTVGTEEAVDASLDLVRDRSRIVTTAAFRRAEAEGFRLVGGRNPASGPFRAKIRPDLIELAATGQLEVPIGRTFPFTDAPAALALLMSGHPGGKLVLTVES